VTKSTRINITTAGVKERHGFNRNDRIANLGEKSQLGLGLQA